MEGDDKNSNALLDNNSLEHRKRKFDAQLRDKAAALRSREQQPTAPAPDRAEHTVGEKMHDGTIYAGISPDTGKAMYATPADASLAMTFNEAKEYATRLDAHGHKDWHVPTKAELNVLFNSRAAVGGFNVTASFPAGWYWSASPGNEWGAWGQRFSDGAQLNYTKRGPSSVRPVR